MTDVKAADGMIISSLPPCQQAKAGKVQEGEGGRKLSEVQSREMLHLGSSTSSLPGREVPLSALPEQSFGLMLLSTYCTAPSTPSPSLSQPCSAPPKTKPPFGLDGSRESLCACKSLGSAEEIFLGLDWCSFLGTLSLIW